MPLTGRLLVCATPIGNLGDVTARVLEALAEADVIVAEDTRVTRKLLARYDIHTPLERYDDHSRAERTQQIVDRMQAGEAVALVSDAGTPGISDPGSRLVTAALDAEVPVDVLPGPSAITTALVASGLPSRTFYFGGFLPRKAGERRRRLADLFALDASLVFYESPRRAAATAAALAEALPGRAAAMARELTKVHEEIVRLPIEQLASELQGRELKGEVVLLVGPPAEDTHPAPFDDAAVLERVKALEGEGVKRSEATKLVAVELGLPRNAVYEIAHGKRPAKD
jgi:16S rRNA (cytidine1402-2'-O)-methyltransferase